MSYEVVYDITRQPPFAIEMVWLSGGLFVLGAIGRSGARVRRSRPLRAT